MSEWMPETRPVPEELTDTYTPATYPKPATKFATWAEQLNKATAEQLKAMAKAVL